MANFFRSTTQRQNDNIWMGDEIIGHKAQGIIRMMFHNINGLSIRATEGLDMLINEQSTLDVDIQGIIEHCLDTTKYQVYQTSQDIVRRQAQQQALLVLHSSRESALNLYKPGGTGFADKIVHHSRLLRRTKFAHDQHMYSEILLTTNNSVRLVTPVFPMFPHDQPSFSISRHTYRNSKSEDMTLY